MLELVRFVFLPEEQPVILFFQEILRTAELYSPFTTTEEDVMNNELVGGLMSNVSALLLL